MGNYKVKAKIAINDIKQDDILEDCEFSAILPNGTLLQLEPIEEEQEEEELIQIKSGTWTTDGQNLIPFSYLKNESFQDYSRFKEVKHNVDNFFENIQMYIDLGIEVPKRNIMIYGDSGVGKSACVAQIVKKYEADSKAAVMIWSMSNVSSDAFKNFMFNCEFVDIDKFIVIIDDICNCEAKDFNAPDINLLDILDNNDRVFIVPTCIIATTSFPYMFTGSVVNNPSRFDIKIEVQHPRKEDRVSLLQHFTKGTATKESVEFIKSDDCKRLTPAHILESVIRSKIKKISLLGSIKHVLREIDLFERNFKRTSKSISLN